MKFHLEEEIFNLVKNGTKNVEIRINDEKRRKLKVGDNITFINRGNNDILSCKIDALEYYSSFNECILNYDINRLYSSEFTKKEFVKLLYNFYTEDEESKYGVVAISFSVCND